MLSRIIAQTELGTTFFMFPILGLDDFEKF